MKSKENYIPFEKEWEKEMMIWEKVDIINLLKKVINESGCKCTEETRTGTTKVECCNICGKPVEAFWLKQGFKTD